MLRSLVCLAGISGIGPKVEAMLRTYAPAVFPGPAGTFLLDVNVFRVLIDMCIVCAPPGGGPDHKEANGGAPLYWPSYHHGLVNTSGAQSEARQQLTEAMEELRIGRVQVFKVQCIVNVYGQTYANERRAHRQLLGITAPAIKRKVRRGG